MELHIKNETAPLKAVILGIADHLGKPLDINPVSRYHIKNGTYPTEADIKTELDSFEDALKTAGVAVYRPNDLKGVDQIFTRDIGFVIDDKFIVANMKESVRQVEFPGIEHLLSDLAEDQIIHLPSAAFMEGGDVIVHNDHIFVGISKRTNRAGYEFLKKQFPNKQVHALPLVVTDDPATNVLHLDCAFQPVGHDAAIIYEKGFASKPEILYQVFSDEQLIKVSSEQKQRMFPNVFSITPNKVVIEENFTQLADILALKGIESVKVKFKETSKLSGLLRCSTLPLSRS